MTDVTGSIESEPDETTSGSPEPTKRSRSKSAKLFARDVLFILIAAILISFLIKTFLIRSFYIPSDSMNDTLLKNDRIIVNQLEPDLMPIEHGDVIVFTDPGGWLDPQIDTDQNPFTQFIDTVLSVVGLTAPDSNDHLIKRVIGLPGDHITCCGNFGFISVNGVPLDEPYVKLPSSDSDAAPEEFDVTVPEDRLWVMGDNRYNSGDSLFHNNQGDPDGGFVPIENVVGRALLITWPIDRWTWLDNFPVVFDGVSKENN